MSSNSVLKQILIESNFFWVLKSGYEPKLWKMHPSSFFISFSFFQSYKRDKASEKDRKRALFALLLFATLVYPFSVDVYKSARGEKIALGRIATAAPLEAEKLGKIDPLIV